MNSRDVQTKAQQNRGNARTATQLTLVRSFLLSWSWQILVGKLPTGNATFSGALGIVISLMYAECGSSPAASRSSNCDVRFCVGNDGFASTGVSYPAAAACRQWSTVPASSA